VVDDKSVGQLIAAKYKKRAESPAKYAGNLPINDFISTVTLMTSIVTRKNFRFYNKNLREDETSRYNCITDDNDAIYRAG